MCGICGVYDPSGNTANSPEILKSMADAMIHRGPDDWFLHFDSTIGLAHRRLSIIDLSTAGRQPMCNEDRTIWVSFNGEIYNFQSLRPYLEKQGHTFVSNTDTEVIIHLYEEMGEGFIKQLNGMFAIGLWDSRKQKLIIARDRLGVKPVVYFRKNDGIVFASEIKALQKHPQFEKELDYKALELFFTYNFIPAPWTIYSQVKKLPQASYMVVDKEGINIKRYWDIPSQPKNILTEDEMAQRLRALVLDSTKIRLFSDVPLGVFLSGGIDSSVVTAAAARSTHGTLKTFCAGYPGSIFDERKYAQDVASMYGTDHTVLDIVVDDSIREIENILSSFDEPFGDSSALPTFLISRLTRQHVTVALSGDGGDEVFGGYRRYLAELFIQEYLKIPGVIRNGLIKPLFKSLPDSKDSHLLEIIRRLKIFVAGASDSEGLRHYQWLSMFPDADRNKIFRVGIRQERFNNDSANIIMDLRKRMDLDRYNRMLYTDVSFLLCYDMLTKVDWMSMLNSLEVRSPLLDYRMSEFAFSLPGSVKFKNGSLKYLLKKSFKDWLPASINKRPKQGFEVPIGEWFRTSSVFQKLFWDTVHAPGIDKQGLFNVDEIKKLTIEHCERKRDNTHKLWAIMVFQWWYKANQ